MSMYEYTDDYSPARTTDQCIGLMKTYISMYPNVEDLNIIKSTIYYLKHYQKMLSEVKLVTIPPYHCLIELRPSNLEFKPNTLKFHSRKCPAYYNTSEYPVEIKAPNYEYIICAIEDSCQGKEANDYGAD